MGPVNRSAIFFGMAATLLVAGRADASLLFSDNFDGEAYELNATLDNWTVTGGTVDLIGSGTPFDFGALAGNGKYVDLDGSSFDAGIATSSSFLFANGTTYTLSFDLAGNQRGAGLDRARPIRLVRCSSGASRSVTPCRSRHTASRSLVTAAPPRLRSVVWAATTSG